MNQEKLPQLIEEIEGDLSRFLHLKQLIEEAQQRVIDSVPSSYDLHAIGSILHNIYNGAEDICLSVAKEIDNNPPSGDKSHKKLLDQMAKPFLKVRVAVLRPETVTAIQTYMGFRHVFRHKYGSELRWEDMKPLLDSAPDVIDKFVEDIQQFIVFLSDGAADE